jgi:hypothetical protein
MNRTSRTRINWTKLIGALVLSCSISSFSAMAQTDSDKPMDAKSLTVLVEELKEVVAKTAPDEKEAALVAERWDRRKDLAGKTKKDVIKLLFEDVKSVIKDSGTQYQIYSIFSFYKRIPDESPSAQTQDTNSPTSKPALVKKLVDLTFPMHPFVGIDELAASLPGTKEIKAEEERVRQVRREVFDNALKVNDRLTPDQKTFVKANYDRLSKSVDKIIDDTIQRNFPTEQWVREGLRQSYTTKFSLKELTSLVAYFQGTAGQQVLKYVRLSNLAELITGNGGQPDYTEADKAEHDRFASNPLGKKFMTAFITDAEAYEKRKVNAAYAGNSNADGFAILEPANLNTIFNKFVSENYRT